MQKLRISIEPRSAFISPLQSDSLFGQFCWAWRETRSEASLASLLQGMPERPPLVFSSAMPQGFLPWPLLPPPSVPQMQAIVKNCIPRRDKDPADLQNTLTQQLLPYLAKKLKKLQWIRWGKLQTCLEQPLDSTSLLENYLLDSLMIDDLDVDIPQALRVITQPVYKNALSRITDTTTAGGQSLYHFDETFYGTDDEGNPPLLDIYALIDPQHLSVADVQTTLELIGTTGFGKDKSTGKGRFALRSIETDPEPLQPQCETPNGFLSLSHGVIDPAQPNVQLHSGRSMTKFGKHGGTLATQGRHIKNPLMLYRPGSLFAATEQRDHYGTAFELDPHQPGHWHSAHMVGIPVQLQEDSHD